MLSYSSGTSGSGVKKRKMRKSYRNCKISSSDILVDGIQYDAAVNQIVGKSKLPNSPVAGQIMLFILDLNTRSNAQTVQRETGALELVQCYKGHK